MIFELQEFELHSSIVYQNVYHVDSQFTQRRREFFLYTLHLSSAEAYSEPLQTSKTECFCVSS